MNQKDFLITAPQFNMNVLKQGMAIHVKWYSIEKRITREKDCLIVSITPQTMKVYFKDVTTNINSDTLISSDTLDVIDVIDKFCKITLLKEVESL